MTQEDMIDAAKKAIRCQDIGDFDGQMTLYAGDCTFLMPHLSEPMRGSKALRASVETWPKSITEAEWFAFDGNRMVMGWNWRRLEAENEPLLRGVSVFCFNEDGLIQNYEDFFDPDWITRHAG